MEFEALDTKLLNNPIFREEDSNKWKTRLGLSYEQSKKPTFNPFNELTLKDGSDPFIEGSQALGQKTFERERHPELEVSKSPFSGMIPTDPWKNNLLES